MKIKALIAAILAAATLAHADDPKRLIEGCKQLVHIYDKQDQSSLLAGWTTSVSDALKAGYCRGVIDEFLRTNDCARIGWHRQAKLIAGVDLPSSGVSTEDLLEYSCAKY